jgi:hypothetical protein
MSGNPTTRELRWLVNSTGGFACLFLSAALNFSGSLPRKKVALPLMGGSKSNCDMKNNLWRAIVEVGFIIFLFYSNLLMGEMESTASGRDKGLLWDLHDIFTRKNFLVAVVAALIGYVLVERLRDGVRYERRKQ